MLPNSQTGIMEYFNRLYIHNPKIISKKDAQDFSQVNPILGLDFLTRYKISLQDNYMILEK